MTDYPNTFKTNAWSVTPTGRWHQSPFFRVKQIPIKVKNVKLEKVFRVNRINKNAILSMSFLARRDCSMDFTRPVVTIGERELVCTDHFGRLVKVVRKLFQNFVFLF